MKTRKYTILNTFTGILAWIIIFLGINTNGLSQDYIKPTFPVFNNLEVNTFNGNLIYTRQDFLIKGNMPINIAFYYNSVNDTVDYGYGSGWYFNYGMNYYFDSLNNIVIIRNGGRKDLYLRSGSNYLPPVGIYDQLVEYEPQKYVLTTKEKIKYFFSDPTHKKLTGMTDKNGNSITIGYSSGLPVTISNSSGRSASLSWTNNHLTGITFNNTSYAYQYTDNQLSKVTNPKGFAESYQYLTNGKLSVILDYNKFPVYIQYTDGVVVSSVKSCLAEKSFSFTENKSFVIENGKQGKQITSYVYDASQRIIQITNPNQKSVYYEYDNNNNVTKFTDFEGKNTVYTYDANGNLLTTANPAGFTTQSTYDQESKLLTSIDEKGNTSNFSYDNEGNLQTVSQPLSVNKSFSYSSNGNITQSIDPLGHATGFTWDANNNLTRITYPIGSVGMVYDNFGNMTKITDANANSLEFEYNGCTSCGKVSKVKINDTIFTLFNYDGNGNLVQETDANGNQKSYDYDGLNRLSSVTIPAGTTQYQYDEQSNLTAVTDANAHTTSYDYNPTNQVTAEADPLGHKATYDYDANGNLVRETDPNGNTILYTYNSLNQLVEKSYPGNSDHFAYDAVGNLVNMYNNDINISYTYDALNRLISKTINNWNKTISYTYDKAGNRLTMTDPDGGVTYYAYDANSRLVSLTNPFNETTTFAYDPGGRVTRQNNSNGTYVEYTYNQRNLLVTLKNRKSTGENISSYHYTYDKHGNRLTMTVNDTAVHRYTYDASHRLTQVIYPDGETERFTYDGAGNRITHQINDTLRTYSYNQADQIISDGKATYTFDFNGNMTSKTEDGQTTTYVYNALNRLVKILFPDGTENNFTYDPFGNRISLINKSGQITKYLLDGENVLIELNNSDIVQARYTNTLNIDSWVSLHRNNQSYIFHKDGLNSTTGLSANNQELVGNYNYEVSGEFKNSIATPYNVYTFTGREFDKESGIYYYRSRYYMPAIGSFLSKDSKSPILFFPQTFNKYCYAWNNPTNYIDPDGKFIVAVAVVLGAGIIVYSLYQGLNKVMTKGDNYINATQKLINESETGDFDKMSADRVKAWNDLSSSARDFALSVPGTSHNLPITSARGVITSASKILIKSAYNYFSNNNPKQKETVPAITYENNWEGYLGRFGEFCYTIVEPFLNNSKSQSEQSISIQVIRPIDPNEILGPPGYDTAKWVSIHQSLPYNILFENDPEFATAPAQNVLIKVPVNSKFNINDFRLDRFGFGNYIFEVPQNSAQYTQRLDLRNSLGLFVDVTAGLNVNTQEAFWLFESIDPATGLSPTDPMVGFLPVNDTAQNAGNGEGFVSFTIKAKSTDQTGDSLLAHASIVFDNNAPILTKTWCNIVDALPPVSSVDSIPSDLGSNTYHITFSSQDDLGGCGVVSCQLYTSKDSAPFILFGEFKPDTVLKFTGSGGSTYQFFSIAKDYVGNIEPMKSVPDAVTTFHDIKITTVVTDASCYSYSNGAISLSVKGGVSPYSYIWSNGESTRDIGSLAAGVYTVTVTDIDFFTVSESFTVNQPPQWMISATGATSVCATTTNYDYCGIISDPSNPGATYTYHWSVLGGDLTSSSDSSCISVTWLPVGMGQLTLQITRDSDGCTLNNVKMININPLPVPTITGTSPVCFGSTGNTYSTEPGMTGYTWNVSSGGTITQGGNSLSDNVTVTWNSSGNQTVSLNYTNQSGCTAVATSEFPVVVFPALVSGSMSQNQIICYNTIPVVLTAVEPSGGNTPYSYQWQRSTDNANFSNIPGATSLNYAPAALTASTYYRQLQTSANSCGTLSTNTVKITVYPQFVVGSIYGNQTICYNSTPSALNGNNPTGGNTPYNYQWQQSSNGLSFTNIPGATSKNYSPPALITSTWYRQIQSSASNCGSLSTNVVKVTVYPQFLAGSVSGNQVICYNTIPVPLSGIAPSGGNSPYTYQWQQSEDNVTFKNVTGATLRNYSPPALTKTTYFRLLQTSASGCGTLTTNVVTVNVYPQFVAGSVTGDQVICNNTVPATLTATVPSGGNLPFIYQWQRSVNNTIFSNITGATSLEYSPPALTSTTWFRLVQYSASGCGSLYTNIVTITVKPSLVAGSVLSDQIICYNNTPVVLTGVEPSGGSEPYSYQWQSSTDNDDYINIIGATSLNYSPSALTSTTYFRQVQISGGGCGSVTTNMVTMTVYPQFVAGSISSSQTICYNTEPATLTRIAPSGGVIPYTYQWQSSTNNVNFSDIGGATQATYQPGALTETSYYRQIQSSANGCGDLPTNVVAITVYPQFLAGSVSSNQTICYNTVPAALTGLAPTGGNTPYAYQWQSSSDNVNYANINGATQQNYQPSALTSTTYFRMVQSSASGCLTLATNSVAVIVNPEFAAGSISGNQAICYNTSPSALTGTTPTGGNTPYNYQWQLSTDNAAFTNVSGATSLSYTPPLLTSSTYYRQVQTSASGCGSLTTNVVAITVYPQFMAGTIAADQAIIYNSVPEALTRISPTGGSPPYTYQWQSSTDNAVFSNIPGATTATYLPGALTATMYYRQLQTSSSGCSMPGLLTNVVTITVFPNMIAGTIASDQVISQFATPELLTGTAPTGGNPPYSYLWEKSTDNLSFSAIPSATSLNYQSDPLSVTTFFRQVQSSTGDFGVITNVVTITVTVIPQNLSLNNVSISANQSQCYDAIRTITVAGDGSTFLVKSGGSVNLIAGENILMRSGTKVENGGYLHGYITNTGAFCGSLKISIPSNPTEVVLEQSWSPMSSSGQTFGCFPNPTPGRFTLWLSEEPSESPVLVKIYNLLGVEIVSKVIYCGKSHEMSLENQAKGVYILTVTQNGNTGVIKVIRQ